MMLSNLLYKSNIYKYISPKYSGIGHIFTFHRIYPSNNHPLTSGITVTPEYLEYLIKYLIGNDIEIISLDELNSRLINNSLNKRFACLTFDDGYIDNYTYAYPILKKYNVPFTIYLISKFPDHQIVIWWYMLEELVLKNKKIEFKINNQHYSFNTYSENEKMLSFRDIRKIIIDSNTLNLHNRLCRIFQDYFSDIYSLTSEYALSWEHIKELANDEIVTIGAHTRNHIALSKCSIEEAKDEIIISKQDIEFKIEKNIEHFAYPFGSDNEADIREFELTKQLGFKTATTTRRANVFREHQNFLTAIPRINTRENFNEKQLSYFIYGLTPFIKGKGQKIITR